MEQSRQFTSDLEGPARPLARLLESTFSRVARPGPRLTYAVAVIAAAVATTVSWLLADLLGPKLPPYIACYPLIMLAALYGGTGPGLLATALAALGVTYFFLHPTGSFAVAHQVGLALFVVINVAVSFVCGALRRARHRTFAEARRAAASDERFRLFMDHTPTLAWIKDDQGRYTYINKAYEQRFSHTLDECQGKTDADLWPLVVAARLQKTDQAVLAAGHPIEVTEETTEPNGKVSFWLNTKFPIRNAAGRQFIASIGLDITDRKRFQEAVQDSETRLRLAVETAELGTYERDLTTDQITLNPACQAILGATDPLPPDLARRALHPADRDRVLAEVARAFDLNLRAVCSSEFRILRPDGTVRWVAGRGRVLFDDDASPPRPIKFIGVLNDITERKNYEAALRHSEARLSQAIRVARLGTFEHDHVSDTLQFSPELRDIYGFGLEEPISFPAILQRTSPEDREQLAAAIHRAHDPASDGLFEAEHRILVPGRPPRWMSVRAQTFFAGEASNRRPVLTIGAMLDITAQKDHAAALDRLVHERTAKLEETVAELEHFSYTITHDMRAPLRAMTGYAGILNSLHAQSLSDQGRDLLRRISESALRMDQLITDALQYGHVMCDHFHLQALDPATSVRGIVESYPQFQPPHVLITIQPNMPSVLANEAALTQVFSNLLGNAVKFVTPGQVPQIKVSAEIIPSTFSSGEVWADLPSARPQSSTDWVRLSVTDNGIGIHPQYHHKVWGMFQRLNKNYEGTGIGLALVRKVVDRMGGRVGVESAPGHGSRFWVELQKAP